MVLRQRQLPERTKRRQVVVDDVHQIAGGVGHDPGFQAELLRRLERIRLAGTVLVLGHVFRDGRQEQPHQVAFLSVLPVRRGEPRRHLVMLPIPPLQRIPHQTHQAIVRRDGHDRHAHLVRMRRVPIGDRGDHVAI